ncbi:hypothetical protein LCGC14_1529810 [marine sediment metagenome]|uniref:Uncharacterized protein n=1 Tax=marine sediment metagenome TaxID=412755 RepID=A0A0F9IWI1_9ZZZZ
MRGLKLKKEMNESFKHIRIVNNLNIELKNSFLGSYKIQLHPLQFFCLKPAL